MLSLQQTKLPAGQNGNQAFIFGYNALARRYYMITVTAGASEDSVSVGWFTMTGSQWRFTPVGDSVGGRVSVRQLVWDLRKRAATEVAADSLDPVPPPTPRSEMSMFANWPGKWPDKHTERGLSYDGTFDSKLVSNGNFLVWAEKNNITVDSTAKTYANRQVRIWGFNDVPKKFFRVDVLTFANHPTTPVIIGSPAFEGDEENRGLLLLGPFAKEKVGAEVQPVRYAIGMLQRDTIIVSQQYLFGGVTWTDAPGGLAKWGRLK